MIQGKNPPSLLNSSCQENKEKGFTDKYQLINSLSLPFLGMAITLDPYLGPELKPNNPFHSIPSFFFAGRWGTFILQKKRPIINSYIFKTLLTWRPG